MRDLLDSLAAAALALWACRALRELTPAPAPAPPPAPWYAAGGSRMARRVRWN